jgi:hypothetical protein
VRQQDTRKQVAQHVTGIFQSQNLGRSKPKSVIQDVHSVYPKSRIGATPLKFTQKIFIFLEILFEHGNGLPQCWSFAAFERVP